MFFCRPGRNFYSMNRNYALAPTTSALILMTVYFLFCHTNGKCWFLFIFLVVFTDQEVKQTYF